MIGGIYQDQDWTADTGVPGLMDVPVIGWSGRGERNHPETGDETGGSVARTGATGGAMLPELLAWSSSLSDDSAFFAEDVVGSAAHVTMLARTGLVAVEDARAIRTALLALLEGAPRDALAGAPEEDVHMAVEAALTRRIGPVAGRLHTARSRNGDRAPGIPGPGECRRCWKPSRPTSRGRRSSVGSTTVERAALDRRRAFDRFVADLVGAAQRDGDIDPDRDALITARLLFGLVNSIVEWYRPTRRGGVRPRGDAVCAMAFEGLRVRRG